MVNADPSSSWVHVLHSGRCAGFPSIVLSEGKDALKSSTEKEKTSDHEHVEEDRH